MLSTLTRRAAVLTAALGLALTAAAPTATAGTAGAQAAPITVRLTVTGATSTVFNGQISTTGHDVTTAGGGTHTCDGTNGGANPGPGATPTAALDDAARTGGFTWDGDWYASFDDYLVTRIAADTQTADAYWNISVNGVPTSVGGCQHRLQPGDNVAFTWTEL